MLCVLFALTLDCPHTRPLYAAPWLSCASRRGGDFFKRPPLYPPLISLTLACAAATPKANVDAAPTPNAPRTSRRDIGNPSFAPDDPNIVMTCDGGGLHAADSFDDIGLHGATGETEKADAPPLRAVTTSAPARFMPKTP